MAIRLVLLVLLTASSAAAQVPAIGEAAGSAAIGATPALPFAKISAAPLQVPPRVMPGPAPRADADARGTGLQGPRRKVVCGMTLLIVGAEPDPKMVAPRPDGDTRFAMRRYDPPACGKEK